MLADSRDVAAYYDDVVAAGADPKVAANWVMGEIMAHLKQEKAAITEIRLSAAALAELLTLIAEGAISGKVGDCCCAHLPALCLRGCSHVADCERHPPDALARRRQPPCTRRSEGLVANFGHQRA